MRREIWRHRSGEQRRLRSQLWSRSSCSDSNNSNRISNRSSSNKISNYRIGSSNMRSQRASLVLTEAGRYDLARESLEQALKIDPGGFSAHQQMARLDDLTDHPQDALGHLSKAIEAGAAKVEASKIYHLRKAGLHILVDMIDRDLEPGKGPDGRAEAASYHRRLESELQSLSQDREKIPDGAEKDDYAYTTAFFEGCLASSQGVLKSEGAGPGEPNRAFDDAGRHFERARELASRQGVAIDRVLPIRAQEEKLAKRRDAR